MAGRNKMEWVSKPIRYFGESLAQLIEMYPVYVRDKEMIDTAEKILNTTLGSSMGVPIKVKNIMCYKTGSFWSCIAEVDNLKIPVSLEGFEVCILNENRTWRNDKKECLKFTEAYHDRLEEYLMEFALEEL